MLDGSPARIRATSTGTDLPVRVGVLALGGLGGSGRVAQDLACGLARQGQPTVLLTCESSQFGSELSPTVHPTTVRAPRCPVAASDGWVHALADDLERAVVGHRLTVLSVHYGVGLAEAAVLARDRLAARGVSVRVYVTLHGTDVTRQPDDPSQRERLADALRRADSVTAVSGWLAEQAVLRLGLTHAPVVIGNGIDNTVFHPAPRGVDTPRTPLLVHASNFRTIKRPLDALEVVHRLRHRGCPARLEMIGDGPLRRQARERAAALDLGDAVRFVDPLPQARLADHFRRADVALVTSECESFSLVAVESMACGAMVAGWRREGLLGTLGGADDLGSNLLAPYGDFEALTDRIASVLGDAQLAAAVRERCIARGGSGFSRDDQISAYMRLFQAAAEERWDADAKS